MNIQIFGTNKSFDTKKAQRWFKERRIKFQMVDLKEKGLRRKIKFLHLGTSHLFCAQTFSATCSSVHISRKAPTPCRSFVTQGRSQ